MDSGATRWRAERKVAALSSRPLTGGALNAEPKPRRWPWLAILALLFLVLGYLCGLSSGRAWGRERPCALAPGGTVKVEQAGGNGTLYTCSRDGEVMSRIPWAGGGVEP